MIAWLQQILERGFSLQSSCNMSGPSNVHTSISPINNAELAVVWWKSAACQVHAFTNIHVYVRTLHSSGHTLRHHTYIHVWSLFAEWSPPDPSAPLWDILSWTISLSLRQRNLCCQSSWVPLVLHPLTTSQICAWVVQSSVYNCGLGFFSMVFGFEPHLTLIKINKCVCRKSNRFEQNSAVSDLRQTVLALETFVCRASGQHPRPGLWRKDFETSRELKYETMVQCHDSKDLISLN